MPRITLRGSKFSLNITEGATCSPEAVPLKNIQAQKIVDALLRQMGSMKFASEFFEFLGISFLSKMMKVTSQVYEGDYIELLKGKRRIEMIEPYCRKENVVLLALKEADSESLKLPYGERRSGPKYTPEEVQICHSLSPEQQKEARGMLIKCKQGSSNKPGVAKGVVHKVDTGDAHPQAVTPYRVDLVKLWGQKVKFV